MDDTQFNQLNEKLDFISKALVLNIVKDLEFKEQVKWLFNLGLKEVEIIRILNSTRNKVNNIVRQLK